MSSVEAENGFAGRAFNNRQSIVSLDDSLSLRLSNAPRPVPVMRPRVKRPSYLDESYNQWAALTNEDLCAVREAVRARTYRYAGLQDYNDRIATQPEVQARISKADAFLIPGQEHDLVHMNLPDMRTKTKMSDTYNTIRSSPQFNTTPFYGGGCNPYRVRIKDGIFVPSSAGSDEWRWKGKDDNGGTTSSRWLWN